MNAARLIATLLACCCAAGASAGDLVVIASSVPAYPKGTIMAGNDSIAVPAGASITLISASGKSLRIDGPRSGAPAPDAGSGDRGLLESLARIVAPPATDATHLAVFRGLSGQRPDLWSVNAEDGGTYCVPGGRTPTLWRKRSGAAATASLASAAGGAAAQAIWNRGAHLADWPPGLGAADGAHYLLRWFEGDAGQSFQLRLIPVALPSDAHRAAWMHAQGCERQARDLVEGIAARGE